MISWKLIAKNPTIWKWCLDHFVQCFSSTTIKLYLLGGLENFYFPIYRECQSQQFPTLSFFRGVGGSTTNQNSVFQMDGLDLNSFEVTEVLTSCGPLSRLPLYVTSAIIRGRFGDLISERFNGLVEEKFTSTRGFYHQNLGLLPLKFAS
jgi:hypothetical protein